MFTIGSTVDPKNRRQISFLCDRAKNRVDPRHVANDHVDFAGCEDAREAAPSPNDLQRIAGAHRAQAVNPHSGAAEFLGQAAFEADRKLGVHLGTQIAASGEREQERFHAAEQVAGIDVQYAHQAAAAPCVTRS